LIAAEHLQNNAHIIEIGGGLAPISHFLKHRFDHALSVDPLITPLEKKTILHVKEDYRHFSFFDFTKNPYALVILGMDLPLDMKLIGLCQHASKIIIEFASNYSPSLELFQILQKSLDLTIDMQIGLDFSSNHYNVDDSYPVFPLRQFYILSPKKGTNLLNMN
jgi:hypothetical protein